MVRIAMLRGLVACGLLAALALPGLGGVDAFHAPPGACAPGWQCGDFAHAEGSRFHMRWLPAGGSPAGEPWRLLVLLHGCTRTAAEFAAQSGVAALAGAEGFAVLMPEQAGAANGLRCWNWHVAGHQQRGQGEPAILEAMARAAWAQANPAHAFDRGAVMVAGLSAGAAFATVLAATYPESFGAVAAAAGLEYRAASCAGNQDAACAPGLAQALAGLGPDPDVQGTAAWQAGGSQGLAVRALLIQGDADELVLAPNLDLHLRQWAQANDCADDADCADGSVDAVPESEVLWWPAGGHAASVACYAGASGSPLLERWMVHGLTHQWPGGEPDPLPPDATALAWAFLRDGATPACAP